MINIRKIKEIMATLVIIYAIICLTIFVFQRKLQYFPDKDLDKPEKYGLKGFSEEKLTTADGLKITVWFKAAKNKGKVLLYFHGNAGNLKDRADKFRIFTNNSNYGILAVSYRGYGSSQGSPNQEGLLNDAQAAAAFLKEKGYNNKDIILYGESLGSGVAVEYAASFDPFGLILEAPFYSAAEVAKRGYWYLPVDLLLKDRFDSYKYAPQINAPVIIFHGTKDLTVPYKNGKKLYDLFKSRKKLVTVEGAGHLDFDNMFLIEQIKQFFS